MMWLGGLHREWLAVNRPAANGAMKSLIYWAKVD